MKEKIKFFEKELKEKSFFLQERIKEQTCLLNISKLSTLKRLSLENLFREIINFIIPAWQFPKHTYARVVYKKIDIKSQNYKDTEFKIKKNIHAGNKTTGYVEVGYLVYNSGNNTKIFLDEETRLLEAITELTGNIIEKKNAAAAVQKASDKLKVQANELKIKNIALKEILAQIEIEKKELKGRIIANIKQLVLPTVQKLKKYNLPEEIFKKYIEIIENNLADITSSFSKTVTDKLVKLSPRELEISNMIKNGIQTKGISKILNISILTVERHRFNIRKKLGINNSQVNLQTYLQKY